MNTATTRANIRLGKVGHNPKMVRQIITPEGVSLDVRVATAGARAGALMLDIVIILGLMIGYYLVLLLLAFIFQAAQQFIAIVDDFVIIVSIIFLFLLRNAYFLYFELGDRGATWGKRASGIRVASRDGGRLTAEAVIARNLIRDIELFLPLIFMLSGSAQGQMSGTTALLGFIWVAIFMLFPLFNKDRLRCGDLIAGTWVIEAPRAELTAVVAPAETSIFGDETTHSQYEFSDEELSVYGEFELQTLESVLRTDNYDSLVSVCSAICRKIGWNPGSGEERLFLEAYYTQLRAKLERDMRFGKRRADKFSEAE